MFGPDADISFFLPLPGDSGHVGFGFFLRYDQVFAVIRNDDYHFQIDGEDGVRLGTASLEAIDARASMSRMQLGFRATMMF